VHFNGNARFVVLTLGTFFLTLGAAVLIFALIGRVFFDLGWPKLLLALAPVNMAVGATLLLACRRRAV
jgi:hypothetical protein